MKRLILFLLLIPLAFAGWEEIAVIAVTISAALLGVVYAVGFGLGINELQLVAREEFFQLIALGVFVAVLMGANGVLNEVSTIAEFSPGSANMQEASTSIVDENVEKVFDLAAAVNDYDQTLSKEASQSSQCNIVGMGYTVSGCGGYSIMASTLSMSGGILGFAIGELSAMGRLLELSNVYALTLLLPFGILLRTIKLTRGAGGFLLALGISMHMMLPVGIIFNEMLGETFLASTDSLVDEYRPQPTINIEGCTPGSTYSLTGDSNEDNAVAVYEDLKESLRHQLFVILIKATLGPVIALLLMATSIKALTSIAGAEVDVTAISRFV
ncbi:hypothetical protein KKB44_03360 [Candidatus Micrarchaeota archaeon]|nr:hypothetical protein [Candidatus Micrarchaeota archaeon]